LARERAQRKKTSSSDGSDYAQQFANKNKSDDEEYADDFDKPSKKDSFKRKESDQYEDDEFGDIEDDYDL